MEVVGPSQTMMWKATAIMALQEVIFFSILLQRFELHEDNNYFPAIFLMNYDVLQFLLYFLLAILHAVVICG